MKNFIVFTLVLTLIFPAYCFYSTSEVSINEKSDKIIFDQEIINTIEMIIEDGKVEEEEIVSLIEDIEPNQSSCDTLLALSSIYLLWLIVNPSTEGMLIFIILALAYSSMGC